MSRLLRLIDANMNRLQEALRVSEDIARFLLNDKALTRSFKTLRHRARKAISSLGEGEMALVNSRNIEKDIGKKTGASERCRKNIRGVFLANTQRAKESSRVLEETSKLFNKKTAEEFKNIRYRIYGLEKKARFKLETVLHNR